MKKKKYDFLIVGAGLSGSVFAQRAIEKGKTVLVLDKRSHIGGNIYTERIDQIDVHKYGAHIFHTNNIKVWNYVNRFASFNHFVNSPIANYKGELYSLPFNMYTFNSMWGIVSPDEAKSFIEKQRKLSGIRVPKNLEEQAISLVGTDIYEKLIKGYTQKQWGRECTQLPTFIIDRIPVRFTYDNNYFNAKYQGIPNGGYTEMVKKMLDGADVELGVDYLKNKAEYEFVAENIIYSGPIDAFFDYQYGHLEYRSVRFENEIINCSNYQGNAVINYTDADTPWTRMIEHKWFQFGKDENGNEIPKTVITKEYSTEWVPGVEPYYPINDEKNEILLKKYRELALKEQNVLFCGRLAEYKYYDMDQIIETVLNITEKIL